MPRRRVAFATIAVTGLGLFVALSVGVTLAMSGATGLRTTQQLIAQRSEAVLDALDRLIESPSAVNGQLSLNDVHVLPLLRAAAVVKDLSFPDRVRAYFETMMSRIGFKPIPAV